jgi:hypothetical protein
VCGGKRRSKQEAAMQASGITKELLRTLALAQGVTLPDERLDAVLRQYQNYLQSLARMESLPLPREAEPEILFTHRMGSDAIEPPSEK